MVKLNPLLRMAAIAGVDVAIKLHIARGDDLDAKDNRGATPLMLASIRRKKSTVQLLLAAGANPELVDLEGLGAINYAEKGGCGECVALLRDAISTFSQSPPIELTEEMSLPSESVPFAAKTVKAIQSMFDYGDHSETSAVNSQEKKTVLPVYRSNTRQETTPSNTDGDLDAMLNFEPTIEPEEFFNLSNSDSASGAFIATANTEPSDWDSKGVDWDLDLSTAQISGDGISTKARVFSDHGSENDFLKVRNRGRKSIKKPALQTGTRLSIDPAISITWVEETLKKGWCSFDDVLRLVTHCEGNCDLEELCTNLQRNLEAADFEIINHADEQHILRWETKSDASSGDLAEAIEAILTREIRLPGTQKFSMDKSYEQQLLEPISRAKQELQLGILASEAAIHIILGVFNRIREGTQDPSSVSLRNIFPSRLNHTETAEVMAALEALRSWQADGCTMEGKRRREALDALDALDISLVFQKKLTRSLAGANDSIEQSVKLDRLITVYESALARLIHEHLPFARRFAARNVAENEDPEEVFQVVFTGLQRSTRRFDPERGDRFVIYCTFWMQQTLTRWRADEGAAIRVPVHRHQNLTMLDRALDKLDISEARAISDDELATKLEWTTDQVLELRRIPRNAEYPESIEDWDNLLPAQEHQDIISNSETITIVANALAELDSREAAVIKMRFGIGFDEEMTLEEIGTFYDLTRERIRQIETKALQRLSLPSRKARLKELMGIS